jgi:hypothetical protein
MKFLRHEPVSFFGSAGVETYSAYIRALTVIGRVLAPNEVATLDHLCRSSENTNKVRVHGFLSQQVLCADNRWATRQDVIKYVCYVCHGVHPGPKKDNCNEGLLSKIRNTYFYGAKGTGMIFGKYKDTPSGEEFRYAPDTLDPISVELLAAAKYLYDSNDVIALEKLIAEELRSFLAAPVHPSSAQH